ncbi:uncharacterized protein LOC118439036 isoform X1 [Folsomia candida]|uniref:uncharacterized protein LOC118439036 isoform X1 n=1 Tax=Folsomia candida TaxID=158441 RepID=UPI001604F11E|nr:uncharacterized protein LOC118439036 isoform X1 [Folsomia candida]
MEKVLRRKINQGIEVVLLEQDNFMAEETWTKTGVKINYDETFKGKYQLDSYVLRVTEHALVGPGNPKLRIASSLHIDEVTAEYQFFESWFLCLSKTGEFNSNFDQAWNKFKDLARTHKSGIFSGDELAQCFAGIRSYTKVTQFAIGVLTKAVVLKDPERQSVPFSEVANLLTLAITVVKNRFIL